MTGSLVELLKVDGREHVAFVGGGGKSTLALGLGRELAEAGRPIVTTTTTKMGTSQIPQWATVCRTVAEVHAALAAGTPVFLLGDVDGEKVIGVPPEIVDEVFATSNATVIVEADGARRRSFKAPGPHEPVIPSGATLVVIVAGIDAVGGRIGDVCHRPERVAAIAGRTLDDALRPEDIATVLTHAGGGLKHVPVGARVIAALTKVGFAQDAASDQITALVADRLATVVVPAAR